MATTALGAQLTVAHRAAQLAVRARSLQGLMTLWRAVDPTNLGDTIDAFVQAAALLAGNGFDQSAVASARYFESFRVAEGVAGRAAPVLARRPAQAVMIGELRGAALSGIIDARRAGMSVDRASSNGLVRVAGQLVKLVLTGGRMTITGSVQSDRVALGWSRVTTGDPCAVCRMLASRGPTYKTEKSADFDAHGHDACTAEPLYETGRASLGPAAEAAKYKREYDMAQAWARESGTMSKDTTNNQLNNYRRWLANGSPEPGQPSTDGSPGSE